jgi:hypothetical protein
MTRTLRGKTLVLLFAVVTALWASGWFGIAEATSCDACFYTWSACDDNCNHCFTDYPSSDPRADQCFDACENRCFNRYYNCLSTCTG